MAPTTNASINPDSIAPTAANYVHAVKSVAMTSLLHSSGVVPIEPDGTTAPDVAAQARCVWRNIAEILEAAEMTPSDIVSVTTYVVLGEDLGPVMAARDSALGEHMAASTLVVVPALARPEWRMEVAVVAAC